jgi:hypothetical protein
MEDEGWRLLPSSVLHHRFVASYAKCRMFGMGSDVFPESFAKLNEV